MALVLAFYGLHKIRYGHIDLYMTAIVAGEHLFDGAKAVLPGLAIGWLCRTHAFGVGAAVGTVGGILEVLLMNALTGAHVFAVYPGRIAATAILAGITGALTNAVAATAGALWKEQTEPSNPLMQPTGQKKPAAD